MVISTAVILAGGLGTRLRPLTNDVPKPLLPMHGKPILQHLIEGLRDHGVKNVILSVGFCYEKIKAYFGDGYKLKVNLIYSVEKQPLGTGGAVKQAARNLSKPFFLAWGDNLMDINFSALETAHQVSKAEITMVLTPVSNVEQFGVAKIEGKKIIYFVEKPNPEQAPSNLINAGAFVIDPRALEILSDGQSSMERDCFEKLAPLGKIAYFIHQGQWFPTDNLERYTAACRNYQARIDFSKKKIVLADVDQTICESCSEISPVMVREIQRLIGSGRIFSFISGSSIAELKRMVSSKLKLDHHLLGNNGTNYVTFSQEKFTEKYNHPFKDPEKKEIFAAFEKLVAKENLVSLTTKEDQLQDRGSQITLSVLGRGAPKELKLEYDPGGELRIKYIEYLRQFLDFNQYDLKIGGTTSIDVTKAGLGKDWGVTQFLKLNQFSADEILFFGDKIYPGGNDYEVSKLVDCIAVKDPEDTLNQLKKL